jgi:hypothetical protein
VSRIAVFFKPPRFEDEERTRQAFLLHVILWTFIIVSILLFTLTFLFYRDVPTFVLKQVSFGLAVSAFLLVLVRRGYLRSVSIIQITALWAFFTATAWTLAGVNHQAYQIGYALVISIAGFLLGMRGALIMVGVSLLSGGLMVFQDARKGFADLGGERHPISGVSCPPVSGRKTSSQRFGSIAKEPGTVS